MRFGLASIAVGLAAAVSLVAGANAPAASEQAPVGRHRFAKPGTYRVVVRVRDVDGGEATATTRIRATD